MAAKATLKMIQVGPKFTVRTFILALTGLYTPIANGGETLDLSPAGIISVDQDGGKEYSGLPIVNPTPNTNPGGNYAEIMDITAVNALGVKALNNYVIKWYTGGGVEVVAGAYPAALLAPAGGNVVQVTMIHKTLH